MDDRGRHTIRLTNKGVRFVEATIDVALDGMLPRRQAQEVRRACSLQVVDEPFVEHTADTAPARRKREHTST